MSRGLLTGRRSLSLILILALGAAAPVVLSGCGGGDQEEAATQQKPRALVPGAEPDSVAVDTSAVSNTEDTYEAGTLSDAGGVSEDPVSEANVPSDTGDEIKAVPVQKEVRSARISTETPKAKRGSDVGGAYSLQLGSFTNLDNARKQADRISTLGYAPVIEKSDLGGQIYHRVMLLGVGDMAEASRLGEHIHSELDIAYLVRRVN
ncbi:MAG: SPOR domain-containing protein [Candidatus Krumholzibacteria bacterium]|nr:SPOR domain-containing protein [Candidatus Krumholzibacteria bacterium]